MSEKTKNPKLLGLRFLFRAMILLGASAVCGCFEVGSLSGPTAIAEPNPEQPSAGTPDPGGATAPASTGTPAGVPGDEGSGGLQPPPETSPGPLNPVNPEKPAEPDLLPGYCPAAMHRDLQGRCVCHFPDPKLQAIIRGLIHKPSGDIFLEEVCSIQELNAQDQGIQDLNGLQCLVRLTTLDLTRNQISDVTPVRDLVRLQVLIVLRNRVREVGALSRLTQLAMLDIGKNGLIEDASVVANMPNLITLHMEQNRIGSLDPVKKLVHLRTLDAHNNQFRDVSAARDLAELEYLHLSCLKADGITYPDVSAISHKPRLHTLSLVGCDLDSARLSRLTDLPELRALNLDQNRATELGFLSAFPGLEQLILSNNQLTQISGLASVPNLTTLFLSQNQIRDVSVLGSRFSSLSTVYLNNNAVIDLGPLSANTGFGAGDVIDVYGNPFSCEAQRGALHALTGRGATVNSQCN